MFIFESDKASIERIPKLDNIMKRVQEETFVNSLEATLNALKINIKNKDNTYRCLEDVLADVSEWYKEIVKQSEAKFKMDKLEELCRPISDYLKENYCPYDSVVITDDKIRLVRDEIGIPVDRDCKKEDEEFCLYDKWLLRK